MHMCDSAAMFTTYQGNASVQKTKQNAEGGKERSKKTAHCELETKKKNRLGQ